MSAISCTRRKTIMMLLTVVFVTLSMRRSNNNNVCYAFQLTAFTKVHHKQKISLASSSSPSRLFSSVEEEDFFFQASRKAAQDRYEKLKNGEDPFGLFGGLPNNDIDTPASDANQRGMVTSASTETTPDSPINSSAEEIEQSPTSHSDEDIQNDSNVISDSQYSELLSNISPSTEIAVQLTKINDATQMIQDDYNFHKKMMEARFAMETKETTSATPDTAESLEIERKSRIEVAEKAKQISESMKIEEIASAPVITEIKSEVTSGGPGCIRKSDDTTASTKVTYRNRDELLNALYPEKVDALDPSRKAATAAAETQVAPKETTQQPIVTSTDTESEPETPNVNEENVAIGLMVLTKSFFTLKQIVDNKKN